MGSANRLQAEVTELRVETAAAQARAAEPNASAWVAANAGTGKTYVLVMRVLRLLLSGTPPDRILCLTYTKAAAAEMSNRLFARLAAWTTMADAGLAHELQSLTGAAPSADVCDRARTLFAFAIEAPGGLKVQTIHAFCERLLKRFPLEADVAASFAVLDDAEEAALQRGAIDAVLSRAAAEPTIRHALDTISVHAAGDQFDRLLKSILAEADWLEDLIRAATAKQPEAPHLAIAEQLKRRLDVRPDSTPDRLMIELNDCLPPDFAVAVHTLLATGSTRDLDHSGFLAPAIEQGSAIEVRVAALRNFFCTGKGERRKELLTKPLKTARPDLADRLEWAQYRFSELATEQQALQLATASTALVVIADAVQQRLAEAKARRAAMTFDDLIAATAKLLSHAPDAQWVLFKIDGGLDHVLVDEAQDTAPKQWRVIAGLVSEFFTDIGAGTTERTLFAVGDEKQSIYGFQGADPRRFAEMGQHFQAEVRASGRRFHRIPLTLSFRSTSAILTAVDAIFASEQQRRGLTADSIPISHRANRAGDAGLVELWPLERFEKAEPEAAFAIADPSLTEATESSPMRRVAARVADRIAAMLAKGEALASQGRPIRAGDILVLVRKRRPLGPEIIRQLEQRGVAVAGADRLVIQSEIGVEDLMALARVLLLPEDDLALAAVLKSPLFDLDENALFAIAHGRKGSLWSALLAAAEKQPIFYAEAATAMKRWRSEADYLPPFEFLSAVLDRDGGRRKLLARLGPEAADALDELLNRALAYDARQPPSLQGFLAWLSDSTAEIKRDMDQGRDEVRVMTVHAAKGLEAPIVFLPDTCSRPQTRTPTLVPLGEVGDGVADLAWVIKDAKRLNAVAAALDAESEKVAEEHRRLLYVALTRPRDRLYIAGFENRSKTIAPGCWYEQIVSGLDGLVQDTIDDLGQPVARLASPQTRAVHAMASEPAVPAARLDPYPAWAMRKAVKEVAPTIPLAPSRLAPLESEEGTVLVGAAAGRSLPAGPLPEGARFRRGLITHTLLQHLPGLPTGERRPVGIRYLAGLRDVTPAQAAQIVDEVLAILHSRDFAALFEPGSLAEVPIAALLPSTAGPMLRVTGQIDRLAVAPDRVVFVDYKANRLPPASAAEVPRAYILQLAAYRMVLARIYPNLPITAALLWTAGPSLMPLPDALLATAEHEIASGSGWT